MITFACHVQLVFAGEINKSDEKTSKTLLDDVSAIFVSKQNVSNVYGPHTDDTWRNGTRYCVGTRAGVNGKSHRWYRYRN